MPTSTSKPSRHYRLHALKLSAWPQISVNTAKSALSNLKEVRRLLSDPLVWIKDYYDETGNMTTKWENGRPIEIDLPDQVCLIGAAERINGEGATLASCIMAQVISGKMYMDTGLIHSDNQRSELERKRDYIFVDTIQEDIDVVQTFNDHDKTTHTDILKFLDFCVQQAEQVVEFAKAKKGFEIRNAYDTQVDEESVKSNSSIFTAPVHRR